MGATGVTPLEAIRGKKPSVKYLGVFGADVWCHLPREKRLTFQAKMEPGVYLGHDDAQNCPIVLLIRTGKVIRTKDVKYPKQPTFQHAAALRNGQAAIDLALSLPCSLSESEIELPEETDDGATVTESTLGGASSSVTSRGGDESGSESDEKTDEQEDEIECVVDKKGEGVNAQYCVKWKGYSNVENTWHDVGSLMNARESIEKYEVEQEEERERLRVAREQQVERDTERRRRNQMQMDRVNEAQMKAIENSYRSDRVLTRSAAGRMREEAAQVEQAETGKEAVESKEQIGDEENGSVVHMVMSCLKQPTETETEENSMGEMKSEWNWWNWQWWMNVV